tara:strand:- start:15667 stop:15915 length:249 start_codon:yes stop_codon:yes gene_type:complete
MRPKKTIAVADVLEIANNYLQTHNPPKWCGTSKEKKQGRLEGVEVLLTNILHETNNYAGYGGEIDEEGIERKFFYYTKINQQ